MATATGTSRRVREVFSPASMVAHVFAQQTQERGRNAQGNFFFEGGDTIYSYGRHFPIARLVEHRGKKCVLFTTRDYSVTTSGHKSDVRRAVGPDNGPVFYVYDPTSTDHKANLERFRKNQLELAARVMRARSNKEWLANELNRQVHHANAYAEFFKLRTRFSVPNEETIKGEIERVKRHNARERLAAQKRAAEQKAEHDRRLAAWIAGEISYFRTGYGEDIRLRIKETSDGKVVETSLGAEVPLSHALKILPLVRSGRSYERNGHTIHLGHFALDRVDDQGNIKAGCHTIKRDEIERLASLLKV